MVDLHINPELDALVPKPIDEKYDTIANSIKINGHHESIVIWKESITGKYYIIDGHTRYKILKAWGFAYKTSIVWSKEKEGISQEGTGHYIRDTCELLLISTKGTPGTPLPKNRPLGIIKSPRTKIPSQKPDITRHWIEKMYPNEKYLELFAKEMVNGWTGWGDHLEAVTVEQPSTKKGTLDDYEK